MSWESYFVEGEAYSNCAACEERIPYGRSFFTEKGAIFCSEECRAKGVNRGDKGGKRAPGAKSAKAAKSR